MTESSPNVATNSLKSWAPPARACWEAENRISPNMTCAAATPANAPIIWANSPVLRPSPGPPAGDAPESENDGHEHCTRCDGICQECNGHVSSAQSLPHDA